MIIVQRQGSRYRDPCTITEPYRQATPAAVAGGRQTDRHAVRESSGVQWFTRVAAASEGGSVHWFARDSGQWSAKAAGHIRQDFYSQGGSVRAIQIRNFSRNLGRTSVGGPGQWLQTAVRDSGGGQRSVIAVGDSGGSQPGHQAAKVS